MNDLSVEADEVKDLIGRRATPERRRVLDRALASKWEGTQAHAIKALAEWGDRESVETIRKYLVAAFDRKKGWFVRGVAIRALAPIIGPEDVDWVQHLYSSRPNELERHELRHLIDRLSAFRDD